MLSVSRYVEATAACDHGNEPCGSLKRGLFLGQLSYFRLKKSNHKIFYEQIQRLEDNTDTLKWEFIHNNPLNGN
jgi:hypothetical protein